MKGVFFVLCFTALAFVAAAGTSGTLPPNLEYLMRLEIDLNAPLPIGGEAGVSGSRIVATFAGGRVSSEAFSGTVLPGGADYLRLDERTFQGKLNVHGVMKLDSKVTENHDDAATAGLVYFRYEGILDFGKIVPTLHTPPGSVAPRVNPGSIDFFTFPVFETSDPRFSWMNHIACIGQGGMSSQLTVVYDIFRIVSTGSQPTAHMIEMGLARFASMTRAKTPGATAGSEAKDAAAAEKIPDMAKEDKTEL